MKHITTEFKKFVIEKLHEKIKENKSVISELTDKPVQLERPLLTDYQKEFEKIMKDYDYLYDNLYK